MAKHFLSRQFNLKPETGFTLVEALISVAIVAIVGLMITTLLARTFESNTKTKLLGLVKQNGQNSLNFIDNAIRQADAVVCVGNGTTPPALTGPQSQPSNYTGNTIVVKTNNIYTRVQVLTSPGNGSIKTDNPIWTDKSTEYQLCNANLSGGQMLINTDSGLAVDTTTTPPFTLNRVSGPKDVVQIYFALKSTGSSTEFENSLVGNQVFQTTVVLR